VADGGCGQAVTGEAMTRRIFDAHRTLVALGLVLLTGAACRETPTPVRGVGDALQAFIIQDCAEKRTQCLVCTYGGKPTIMAVGDLDDAAFERDLVEIQRVLDAGRDRGLTAFALVGELDADGKLEPFADEAAALDELDALRRRLGLEYPVVIVPKTQTKEQRVNYAPFNKSYALSGSRTILLARADNRIVYAEQVRDATAAAQYDKLAKLASAL
jgi:hypothetical protein